VDKYLTEKWKSSDYRNQTNPEEMLRLTFELIIKKNSKKFLVSEHKDLPYLHCSFINSLKHGPDITTIKSVKEFKELLNQFGSLNESVRDMMQPKSKEDLRKHIDTLVPGERLRKGLEFGVLSKAEARDMIDRLDPEFRLSYGLKYGLLTPREIHEVFITLPLINKIQLMYKTDYRYSSEKLMNEFMILSIKDKEEILNLGDVGIYVSAGGSYREKFDKILKRLRKISSKNISRSKRSGRDNIVYVNESVRDKMTPKPKGEVDSIISQKKEEIEKSYLTLHKSFKSFFDSKEDKRKKLTSSLLAWVQENDGFNSKGLSEEYMMIFIDELTSITNKYGYGKGINNLSEYIDKRILHSSGSVVDFWMDVNDYYQSNINESIRDKMTPKTKAEIMGGIGGDENVTFTPSKRGISGTFLVGELDMSYYDIVKLFGEPEEEAWIGNNFLWVLQTNDNRLITIYDNNSDLEFEEIMEMDYPWHIGGRSTKDFKDISYYIYNNILE
jgi:hypothetical protein